MPGCSEEGLQVTCAKDYSYLNAAMSVTNGCVHGIRAPYFTSCRTEFIALTSLR